MTMNDPPEVSAIPHVRVTGPAALIATVPYLLGFAPTESLVLTGIEKGRVLVTARIDLTDIVEVPTCLSDTFDSIKRAGADMAVALLYSEQARFELGLVCAAVVDNTERTGLELPDILLVTQDRYWSLTCTDQDCCPPEGKSVPPGHDPIAVELISHGLSYHKSREELVAQLTPPTDTAEVLAGKLELVNAVAGRQLEAMRDGKLANWERSVIRALHTAVRKADEDSEALTSPTYPTDAQAARLVVGLRSYSVRDALWMALDDKKIGGSPLWTYLGRWAPNEYGAAPMFLLAWASWRDGEGVKANIAIDLCRKADPAYSAADLLGAAIVQGVNPRKMPKLRRQDLGK